MNFNKTHGSAIPKTHLNSPMTIDNLLEINKKFLGGGMSQNYAAIYFFEYYIQAYDFEYIVEIGSQKGALSLFFANMAGSTERFYFETYEINKKRDWYTREHEGVGHWFESIERCSPYFKSIEADIFDNKVIEHIKTKINESKKCLIFCDGGNKVKEFNVYSDFLKPNDNIIVHDWGSEIGLLQIGSVMQKNNIQIHEPFSRYCSDLKTKLMPFIKV